MNIMCDLTKYIIYLLHNMNVKIIEIDLKKAAYMKITVTNHH